MPEQMCLAALKRSQTAVIAGIDARDVNILRKLLSLQILPGMPLRMIQTFPSYVFEIGHTQVAIDRAIASAIMVSI